MPNCWSSRNLGFSERQLADYSRPSRGPHGMALITGPTGSGKSTTLYATLRRLNRESGNILTIEDPVEYTLEGVNQVQLKEEIGLTFGAALRTFLRQDPDIIMLGEIRDADTAAMAIRSSLTGHLVFSTIHTNSAWGSVSRLRDMGVHPYLLSGTLILCAAQRLVRLLCPDCKKEAELTESEREQVYGPRPVPSDRKEAEGRRGRTGIGTSAAMPGQQCGREPDGAFPAGRPAQQHRYLRFGENRAAAGREDGRSRSRLGREQKRRSPACRLLRNDAGGSYLRAPLPRQDRTHGHLMQKTEQETSVLPGKQDPEAHSHKHYRPVRLRAMLLHGLPGPPGDLRGDLRDRRRARRGRSREPSRHRSAARGAWRRHAERFGPRSVPFRADIARRGAAAAQRVNTGHGR